ncbi:ankyrin repeat-containing domain protein [Xylaria venustula]|nr:ankyrin repeat-containing domain protein [Xylaria venustula]
MLKLSNEIHQKIANECGEVEIAAVARVCKQLYNIYNSLLYTFNVRFRESCVVLRIFHFRRYSKGVAAKSLQYAINAGANIQQNIPDYVPFNIPRYFPLEMFTPLHMAVRMDDAAAITLLLQNEAYIDDQSCSHRLTPLMVAILFRHSTVALSLLDHGATLTSTKCGDNALHLAAAQNLPEVVTYLVNKKGMDPNCPNPSGHTPLLCAIQSYLATKDIITHLSDLGADMNYSMTDGDYNSPLHMAIEMGSWDIAEQLLKEGAHPRMACSPSILFFTLTDTTSLGSDYIQRLLEAVDGFTDAAAIYSAAFEQLVSNNKGYCDGAKLLLQRGYGSIVGSNPKCWSRVMSPSTGCSRTIDLLLQYGAQIPEGELKKFLRCARQACIGCYNMRLEKSLRPMVHLASILQVILSHYLDLDPKERPSEIVKFLLGCPGWGIVHQVEVCRSEKEYTAKYRRCGAGW